MTSFLPHHEKTTTKISDYYFMLIKDVEIIFTLAAVQK